MHVQEQRWTGLETIKTLDGPETIKEQDWPEITKEQGWPEAIKRDRQTDRDTERIFFFFVFFFLFDILLTWGVPATKMLISSTALKTGSLVPEF